jgi:Na+-transporting NADH:ubiquinone oxidoreductase subunit E
MSPQISPFILFFASIFTSNILLANFLGMCSFISISKDLKSSHGLGLAVIVVLTITSVINWAVYHLILEPFGLHYLRFIVFIIVIAAVVQILEMLIDRLSPALYMALGIFLPLITVNCAILGVSLLLEIRKYTLLQSAVYGIGSGLGWWLAILGLAVSRDRVSPLSS